MQPVKRFGVPVFVGLLTISFLIGAAGGGARAADGKADIKQGKQLYMQVCAACHGQQGEGVPNAGKPFDQDLTREQIVATALEGGERMPPFQGTYSRAELNNIAVYITERLLTD